MKGDVRLKKPTAREQAEDTPVPLNHTSGHLAPAPEPQFSGTGAAPSHVGGLDCGWASRTAASPATAGARDVTWPVHENALTHSLSNKQKSMDEYKQIRPCKAGKTLEHTRPIVTQKTLLLRGHALQHVRQYWKSKKAPKICKKSLEAWAS